VPKETYEIVSTETYESVKRDLGNNFRPGAWTLPRSLQLCVYVKRDLMCQKRPGAWTLPRSLQHAVAAVSTLSLSVCVSRER